MRSGTKNCYVDIYRVTETADPTTNAPVLVETLWKSMFANASPRRGREVEIDGQVAAESYMRFDFDYFDVVGVTELDFILYDGVRYGITGLLPDISLKENFVVDTVARPVGTQRV